MHQVIKDTQFQTRLQDALLTLLSLVGFTAVSAALLQSWRLSLILAASLSAHELGHIILIMAHGMRWKLLFSPMGARLETSLAQRQRLNHFENAQIHLAGPLASLVYALIATLAYWLDPSRPQDLLLLANFSAQVALFNLLPLGHASDGGKFIDRVFDSLNNRNDWRIFWLPILWGSAVIGGTLLSFFLQHGEAVVPPQVLGYSLVVLWLLVGMWIEKRHEDPQGWESPQAMTYRQAWRLMVVFGILLLASTLIVVITPFWLPPGHIATMIHNIQAFAAHFGWRP